ncbi:hypothetical protein E4U19_001443 [Claviceps sp. Clav32 group G5]|nr:hypothetical protein E4U19_001443 [Claviceps sp. Clav32 group G5]KAG6044440.1 hypothetical protein E4U39_003351 [Claviceps sp. Clav50 group G5]
MSLVTYRKSRHRVSIVECTFGGSECNMAAWGTYPLIAAAAAISVLTTSTMLANMIAYARKAVVDPLYVFRGIVVTLLVLIPVVIIGWIKPSVSVSKAIDMMDRHSAGFVGLAGTFLLRAAGRLPGAATVAMCHFNLFFGAMIACLSAAMASPALADAVDAGAAA